MFPLGDSTKAQVRAEAAARGLAVADKPDSHDICFIADGDTRGFLARAAGRGARRHRRRGHRRGAGRSTTAPTPTPSASARASTCGSGAGRAAALRAVDHAGDQHGDRRAGRGAGRVRPWTASVRCGPAPADGPVECEVQLRAHGEVRPGDRDGRRRAPGRHAGPAGPRGRRRAGAGRLPAPTRAATSCSAAATISRAEAGRAPVRRREYRAGPWPAGAATGSARCPAPTSPRRSRTVLGELPDLPYLPELPARGPGADMIGRGAGAAGRPAGRAVRRPAGGSPPRPGRDLPAAPPTCSSATSTR